MRNTLIIKNLLFFLVLAFVVSCSKKSDEVSPATLTGKWKQDGTVWKVTYTENGKAVSEDLSDDADNSIIEFNADGLTANYLGGTLNYKVAGSIITFSGNKGVSFDQTISKNGATQLTISYTKDQFYKFLDIAYSTDKTNAAYVALLEIKNNITAFQYDTKYVKQ